MLRPLSGISFIRRLTTVIVSSIAFCLGVESCLTNLFGGEELSPASLANFRGGGVFADEAPSTMGGTWLCSEGERPLVAWRGGGPPEVAGDAERDSHTSGEFEPPGFGCASATCRCSSQA